MDNFDNDYNVLNQNMLKNKHNNIDIDLKKKEHELNMELDYARKLFEYLQRRKKEKTNKIKYTISSLGLLISIIPIITILHEVGYIVIPLSLSLFYPLSHVLHANFNLYSLDNEYEELGVKELSDKQKELVYKNKKRKINSLSKEVESKRGIKINLKNQLSLIDDKKNKSLSNDDILHNVDRNMVKRLKL